jgi:hypothetical protein
MSQLSKSLRPIFMDQGLWKSLFAKKYPTLVSLHIDNSPSLSSHHEDATNWYHLYRDYSISPRWHSEQKHRDFILLDGGLTVTTMFAEGSSVESKLYNRAIRATVDYAPGSGLHYFEIVYLTSDSIDYHCYLGICNSTNPQIFDSLLMWCSQYCFGYGGNGTLYAATTPYHHAPMVRWKENDRIGFLFDARPRESELNFFTYFLNGRMVGSPMAVTSKCVWYPCVGTYHPKHMLKIVVKPQMPPIPDYSKLEAEQSSDDLL